MQTSLPDLPFTNHGNLNLRPVHSTITSATQRSYPRTDLQTLRAWESFPDDIHRAIQSATASAHLPSTPFHIPAWTGSNRVENEERLRAYVNVMLHKPVEEVLAKLGVNGEFALGGGGIVAVVGSPDFAWIVPDYGAARPLPKLIVEYKTWWTEDLEHIVATSINDNALDPYSLRALEQIYAYMSFNNNRFGILTNWHRALFLRRAEEVPGHHTLDFYTVELDGNQDISMLKAWVGIVLLAEVDWFFKSSTTSSVTPNQTFRISETTQTDQEEAIDIAHMQPVHGDYQCHTLDFHLCRFDLSTALHESNGSHVVSARLVLPCGIPPVNHELQVVCKVVDVLRYEDEAEYLDDEVRAYTALRHLQGKVIPTLYGYYMVWGILKLMALEPVGQAITENEPITQQLCQKMKEALYCIHNAGYVHGNVACHNFCRTESGHIFLVGLERCRLAENQAEFLAEMNEIDRL